jgi:hypothetical protein
MFGIAFAQEIVVGVDEKQAGSVSGIAAVVM